MNQLKNKNPKGEFLTYQQVAERSNMGINTVMRLAKESGSLIKVGRVSRINWSVFYEYLVSAYQVME